MFFFFLYSFKYYRDVPKELKEHKEQKKSLFYMYILFPDL